MKKTFNFLALPMRIALFAVFVMSVATAGARDVEQAKQAAMQQMKRHAAKRANVRGGIIANVDPQLVFSKAKRGSEAYYYVFSAGKDLGYTVVSGDDRLPAIVGYTESGEFDAQRMPEGLAAFMAQYQDFVDNATDEQIREVMAMKAAPKHAAVAPLMAEKWNQGAPYNNLCPEYTSGKKSATGCVATAMAQILHYWKCPATLQADIPSYVTYWLQVTMPGISKGFAYDWANMLDVYTGSETAEQNKAVAELMLHVGCSVEMMYHQSSGASATAEAFIKYWGMDKELVQLLDRNCHNIAQWDDILYKEIAAKRPVCYSGQSTGGGHAFVIHGYDDGLYYVNWGWGGYCDGYFDITILNPGSSSGTGASSSSDGYSFGNDMIIGLQPDNGKVDAVSVQAIGSISQLELKNVTVSGGKINADVACTPKNINLYGKINIGIGYVGDDGKYVNVLTYEYSRDSESFKQGYYTKKSLPISFVYEEGKTYKLCLIESKDGTNWTACSGEETTSVTIKIQGGVCTVVDNNAVLSATAALDKESGGYAGMNNTINVTVNNAGGKEYYDMVYIRVGTGATMPTGNTYACGVTVPTGGSATFNFAYKPAAADTYNVWILDKDEKEIGMGSITIKKSSAPVLSLVSISCNNASGDKVYGDFQSDKMEMDKVNDAKAEFAFVIKNDGGYYEGDFIVAEYDAVEKNWHWSGTTNLKIPEGTTTFRFTTEGKAGDVVGIWLARYESEEYKLAGLSIPNKHNVQGGGYYQFVNREFCYLAGFPEELKDLNITYDVTASDVARLNANFGSRTDITSIDLTKAASVKSGTEIKTGNANTLVYVNTGASLANTKNVVVKNGGKYSCDNLELVDEMPFKAPVAFTAKNAKYTRTAASGWYSTYLPFAVSSIPAGVTVEAFDKVDVSNKKIYFNNVTSMAAYTPYIYSTTGNVTFANAEVTVDTESASTGTFVGTLDGADAGSLTGNYVLKGDGSGFATATNTAYAVPFRAWVKVDGAKAPVLKAIHNGEDDGATGIYEVGADSDNDAFYNLKGEKVNNPTKGVYIKNGKKYIFK